MVCDSNMIQYSDSTTRVSNGAVVHFASYLNVGIKLEVTAHDLVQVWILVVYVATR